MQNNLGYDSNQLQYIINYRVSENTDENAPPAWKLMREWRAVSK